jgi:xanthine dehydrogenase YagS FAD-binding subunit
MRAFAYDAPATLDEAIPRLSESARPLAGGTDLLTLMKADLAAPERLIAIRALLPQGISADRQVVTIGAAATLTEIERDETIATRFAAVAQAAALAASPQLRNMATIGGNLLQRPRCWYFRNPHVNCWLKGGDVCQARDGENRQHALFRGSTCVATHPSDLAPALFACDAHLVLRGRHGERSVRLQEFFALPEEGRRRETTLGDDELVLAIRLPLPAAGTRSVYVKAMDRAAFSFALAGVAAAVTLTPERRIQHARLVLSGVAPIPWRVPAAERVLTGAIASEHLMQKAADLALAGAQPLSQNGWKIPLARALVERALQSLMQ